ncbi:formylmethanofuran dehydrogenase [candidate division MSBL1 archaeon SCGC-AAA259E19]|uniref:Formylmethanofuran dehydrogenase n=1 Tax=candidate division MSBL1 archaeon SCGC-AAA259E19 TaxID=1698264 RepID=A0A133ULK4_9EURY|nr:formylmethanofuran dehydrogenase [candidate division MSBL1 archaeon SCGC-AAA259E19]
MILKENVTCMFCGCLCDDLKVKVEDGEITDVKNACVNGRSKILNYSGEKIDKPKLRKDGELVDVSFEEAIQKAVDILTNSKFPLIYGLSSTEADAQRRAVELAEKVGGTIDNTASFCHGPSILAIQASGAQEATLGEVRNRADLLIFWGCNPAEAHIRHPTRYSITPEGMYIPGRSDREIVNVDVRETKTSKMSDIFLKVEPGKDYELLSALRASIKGYEVGGVGGVTSEEIKRLANKMKNCDFGVIFFGLGLTLSAGIHVNIQGALDLVRDLNDHTKFVINPMRGHFNVTGANAVMTWTTGYPFAVNYSRGYPVYGPGEYTAIDVLVRKECDSAMVIASDPCAHFPASASRYLADIPTVLIDPKKNATTPFADVVIPSATAGIECGGTAYRMDGVPLELDKIIDSNLPPDREILERIIQKLGGS